MTKIRVDRWESLYATRVQTLRPSAIRDLMSVSSRPDIISLAGGFANTADFPFDRLLEILDHVVREYGPTALQYGPTEGFDRIREVAVEIMAAEGTKARPENVLITTGATQALDLITKILVDPGDVIVSEAPAYSGAITTFVSYQADIRQVRIDGDGMIIEELEETLKGLKKEKKRAKFIYTVPNFNNPSGVTLSRKRRKRLVELAAEHDTMIVEDNPYGMLRFAGKPLPTLKSLDKDDRVLYLGTLSKILSPGMRLGWVNAPTAILGKLIFGKQATDLCSNSFTQFIAQEYFRHGVWQEYVSTVVETYRRRCAAMQEALAEHFPPEATWTKPQGGFFLWAALPEYLNTTEMLADAIREVKVAYIPGEAFYAEGGGANALRLCFSFCSEDDIRTGIEGLGKVIRSKMELYSSLNPGG